MVEHVVFTKRNSEPQKEPYLVVINAVFSFARIATIHGTKITKTEPIINISEPMFYLFVIT